MINNIIYSICYRGDSFFSNKHQIKVVIKFLNQMYLFLNLRTLEHFKLNVFKTNKL